MLLGLAHNSRTHPTAQYLKLLKQHFPMSCHILGYFVGGFWRLYQICFSAFKFLRQFLWSDIFNLLVSNNWYPLSTEAQLVKYCFIFRHCFVLLPRPVQSKNMSDILEARGCSMMGLGVGVKTVGTLISGDLRVHPERYVCWGKHIHQILPESQCFLLTG